MTPTKYTMENTRALGQGERIDRYTLMPGPNGTLVPVTPDAYGEVVTADDLVEFRRPLACDIGITELEILADHLGLKTEVGRKALEIALANIQLLDRKHCDYGPGNIAAHGEYGILVRCSDKTARLSTLLRNGDTPQNESIDDSWRDLCNYSIIALIWRAGNWR